MSTDAWSVDAVLHERVARMMRMRSLDAADWLGGALAVRDDMEGRTDFHFSTMGPDFCGNYEVIDEPCAIPLPLRITLAGADRLVHVREMPLHPDVTYANYPHDEEEFAGDDGDEHELWRRPILMVEGMGMPDVACAVLSGRRVRDVVETGLDALDGAVIAWAAVEPPEVAAKLLHGRRASQPTAASLVLRLEDMPRIAVAPRRAE